jgi:hypothetical protein
MEKSRDLEYIQLTSHKLFISIWGMISCVNFNKVLCIYE